jgi:hypothetical protein
MFWGFIADLASFHAMKWEQSERMPIAIPVPPRQHPQRRHQDPLRLLHPHRPAAPALAQRPLADRALQPDDVPHAAAGGAAEAAEGIERLADTAAGVDLRVGEIAGPPPPGSRISDMQRMTSKRAMVNCAWKSRAASCISWLMVPARSMMPRVSTVRWCTTGRPSGSASYTGSSTSSGRRMMGRPATPRAAVVFFFPPRHHAHSLCP